MKLLRWLAVGCVATAGMVLAFTAGVWCVKPIGESTAGVPATTLAVPPTVAKATTPAPQSTNLLPQIAPQSLAPTIPESGKWPEIYSALPLTIVPVNAEMPAPITPAALSAEPAPQPTQITPVGDAPQPTQIKPLTIFPTRDSPSHPLDSAKPNYNFNTTATLPARKGPPVQYVDRPEVEFEYDIGQKGKSGVKSVSLFVRDTVPLLKPIPGEKPREGLSNDWKAFVTAEVKDGVMPKLRYTLPAEGEYEFRLGVTNENGLASTPKDTDPADMVVVLDTTPPTINRFAAEPDRANSNLIALVCEYYDDHLDPNAPVVFEYRNGTSQDWSPIRAKSDRQLPEVDPVQKGERAMQARLAEWVIPDDAPAEMAVRVKVIDLAGNVAIKVIDKVNLDTTVPEGKLTKVRPVEPPKKEEPKPVERLVPLSEEKK